LRRLPWHTPKLHSVQITTYYQYCSKPCYSTSKHAFFRVLYLTESRPEPAFTASVSVPLPLSLTRQPWLIQFFPQDKKASQRVYPLSIIHHVLPFYPTLGPNPPGTKFSLLLYIHTGHLAPYDTLPLLHILSSTP
jgi:hypothetical protein